MGRNDRQDSRSAEQAESGAELYDCEKDPHEQRSVAHDPGYAPVEQMKRLLG